MIYQFGFLLGLFGLLVLALIAGPLFNASRGKSSQKVELEYLRLLDELRKRPDNQALQDETRSVGHRFVSFALESRGAEPSKSDFEEIDLEIDDAAKGRGFHSHVSRARTKQRWLTPPGCLIAIGLAWVCFIASAKLGQFFINSAKSPKQNPSQIELIDKQPNQSSAFNN